MEIKVMERVLKANDAWAEENRRFLQDKKIKMLNIIGSPGAGKTSLIETTIDRLKAQTAIAVIEGDIATTRDAERIMAKNVPVYQINTGTACHLDANLVNTALKELCGGSHVELIFVENIGNLVCPAEFDIGEESKIAVLSVTEGDDKVEKYPLLFSEAKALLVSKKKLLEHTNFSMTRMEDAFRKVNPSAPVFPVDSLTGEGFDAWIDYLKSNVLVG